LAQAFWAPNFGNSREERDQLLVTIHPAAVEVDG